MIPRAMARNGMTVDLVYEDGTDQLGVNAQILYDTEQISPETGVPVSMRMTFITLALADLDQDITKVYVTYPKRPGSTEMLKGILDGSKDTIDGKSAGFIRIPVTDIEQI